jgi:hypothetical protein
MNSKKNTRVNRKKSRKTGGDRARSTTLCMYSPNMDNGANGVYGFHPVWGSSCCNNQNLQSQNVDTISKVGVLGGKPFANTKGGRKNKKTLRKRYKKIQRGGQPLDPDAETELEKAVRNLHNKINDAFNGATLPLDEDRELEEGALPPPLPPSPSPPPPPPLPLDEDRELNNGDNLPLDEDRELNNGDNLPLDDAKDGNEDEVSSGGRRKSKKKISKKKISKKKKQKKSRKYRMRGGNNFANVNDGFNCLVKPWVNNSWTKNYNPVAVSDYPVAPSRVLPHTNKYIWNQEG